MKQLNKFENKSPMIKLFSLLDIIENCNNLNNPLASFLKAALTEAMEVETNRIIGQEKKGQHLDKNTRKDYRSGYRKRKLKTSLGEIPLDIPKFR